MRKFSLTALATVLLLASQTGGFAAGALPAGLKVNGGMLVDAKGMTLYTYDKDTEAGKSSCMAQCLAAWPAATAAANAKASGDWSIITRDDGTKQYAYKGKPLYTFAKDAKPGDMTGDGRGKVWHMVMM